MLADADAFVGRTAETRRVIELLHSGARLVMLTGLGGVGKTRMARRIGTAQQLFDDVGVVELSQVDDLALIAGHIAQTVGGGQRITTGAEGWTQLVRLLADRRMLLVLDNCEHLQDVENDDGSGLDDMVAELLAGAPRLVCVATSRRPLQVRGEHEFPLGPLSAPDPNDDTANEDSDALALFAARARASDPTFDLERGDNRAAAARLVHRLGGVPLHVELAAARVGIASSVTEMERRFESAGTYRQLASSVMQWSWDRCSPEEQALWANLSIFSGGWTLEAADEVAGGGLGDLDLTMDSLRRTGLIIRDPSSSPTRFRMLPPLREWVQHQLSADELADLHRKHRAWCARLVADAAEHAHDANGAETFLALRRELPNVRAALMRCHTAAEAEWGLPLAITIANARVPFVAGFVAEWGRFHVARLRALYPHRDQMWVDALATEAWVAVCQGDPEAGAVVAAAQRAAEEVGVPEFWRLYYARGVNSTFGAGTEDTTLLWERVMTALRSDPELPETHVYLGLSGMWQAIAAAIFAEPEAGSKLINGFRDECTRLHSVMLGSWGEWAWSLLCLRRGDIEASVQALRSALEVMQRHQDYWGLPWSLVLGVLLAAERGQWHDTARLMGATDMVMARTEIDFRRLSGLGDAVTEAEGQARSHLEAPVYARYHQRGARLGFEEACTLPLEVLADGDTRSAGAPGLTPRQREVAGLVVQGWTNAEIAEHLGVSQTTINTHVHDVLQRSGARGRRDVQAIRECLTPLS